MAVCLLMAMYGVNRQATRLLRRMPIPVSYTHLDVYKRQVVVVGCGTQKKVNLTGSVGLATAKEIEARPVANATQALQGLLPVSYTHLDVYKRQLLDCDSQLWNYTYYGGCAASRNAEI